MKMKNVEDAYPLSPMQQLMLLHTLSAPESDVLFNQFVENPPRFDVDDVESFGRLRVPFLPPVLRARRSGRWWLGRRKHRTGASERSY